MGRFSIGARVRDEDGDLAEIVGKPAKGLRTLRYIEKTYIGELNWAKSGLTLVQAYRPAVCDRVRLTADNSGWGEKGEVGVVLTADAGDDDSLVRFDREIRGKHEWFVPWSILEKVIGEEGLKEVAQPVAAESQPVGLAIEAGKFYRTRDGRKMGPLLFGRSEQTGNPFFTTKGRHYSVGGECCLFGEPGIQAYHEFDLVAEWVDEPVAAVEPTPERKLCFKLGDRVTPKADHLRRVVGHWEDFWQRDEGRAHGDVFYIVTAPANFLGARISAKPDGDGPYWPTEYFELVDDQAPSPSPSESFIVARLTAKGEPRPNVRPRVHQTLAAAEAEAQRLAGRLGDEFAVYQRVSSKTVDAGPVPPGWLSQPFRADLARKWIANGRGDFGVANETPAFAFTWHLTPQGAIFWYGQYRELTPLGRAILEKWIAEAEASQKVAA